MIPVKQTWPDDLARHYRERGYWRGDLLGDIVRPWAGRTPEAPAVVAGTTRWTYAELDAHADRVASGFLGLGFVPGDRVVVQLPNVAEFLSLVLGLFRAGLVPVFALPAHRKTEIIHFAHAAEASAYVIPDVHGGFDYRGQAEEVCAQVPAIRDVVVVGNPGRFRAFSDLVVAPTVTLPAVRSTDVAFLQLSGGSTGVSKLIPRTHDDYMYSVRGSADICGLGPSSVFMCVLPAAHNYPMSSPGFLGTFHTGGTVVMCPSPAPDVAFPLIAREGVTIAGLVPPLALVWAQAAATTTEDLTSLRVLQVGGAKLTPEVARRVIQAFPETTLQQVFGMAEGLVNYTRLDDPEDVLMHTQGRPISPDDELRVVNDEGHAVARGRPGHLETRGPYTIRGYHNAGDANARAFTSDGFYRTGDIVVLRPDGNLVVQGRNNDMINRGGEKISAEEVEDQLLAHPGIHDAVVVSMPDEYLGERTCAFVIARDAALKAPAVKAWVRSRGLATYKVPDQVVFVEAFPSTGVGKISRRELRAVMRQLTPGT